MSSSPAITVFTHPDCLRHDPGVGHPESVHRLPAILRRLRLEPGIAIEEAGAAPPETLLAVHPRSHLDYLRTLSGRGGGAAGPDTVLNGASWAAVLGTTGAVAAGLRHALDGLGHAFAAVRPPGHHALASRAMGFCMVNNVVVAARQAQSLGRERILIIDWDVHHGNGTQALVESDERIRYVSLHQWPWYPGNGAATERGVGNVFNVPRPPGLPPARYVADLWDAIIEVSSNWQPDIVLISAGFDAMAGDPLGGFTLEPEHYAEWTRRIRERMPQAPILSLLEGGYAPDRVAEGIVAHISAMT